MSLPERLRAVFVDALQLDGDVDVENLKYRDLESWDSVGHVNELVDDFDALFGLMVLRRPAA